MTITVGLVDHGAGNHASVQRALAELGFRCRTARDPGVLEATDVLLLPGVGAFPAAMRALHETALAGWLVDRVRAGQPLVGICLGMQLLADASSEWGGAAGLGLVPGRVRALCEDAGGARWHIGWNTLEASTADPLLAPADGRALYFNHSFVFDAPAQYRIGVARIDGHPLTAAVRRGRVVGLQFHPEKSQGSGRALLRHVIEELYEDA